eukprot:TRINITY_DN4756_c0_g5_i1.p1 TRINITY_DN4756_c0_g5~~TRINITY_DN4756_c0_g5_i1.p1  ORF type:complete len:381 (-),score=92.40 TRINITY_DN4756_c0_g5_i1:113-1255(-)
MSTAAGCLWLFLFCLLACDASPLDAAWVRYLNHSAVAAKRGLQSGCVPRRFRAQGPYRGMVVLFHGFSACPQQYDDLGPLLAAAGVEVLVPLIPGMGNQFDDTAPPAPRWKCPLNDCSGALDDVSGLPTAAQGYAEFAAQINAIAQLGAPPRSIAGLSVGGALAAYAGQATLNGSALYSRQLIMNPMLVGANKRAEAVLRVLNGNPVSRELWLGWGEGCRRERAMGRAGICTFHVDNTMAAGLFGERNTLEQLAPVQNASVLVLYDQADPVVDTAAVRRLATKYRQQGSAGLTQSCVLNFTMHSMLSKWDDVGANKWWLNELDCNIVGYIAHGAPFRMDQARSSSEAGERYCHLGCSAASCPFNASAAVRCPYTPAPPRL